MTRREFEYIQGSSRKFWAVTLDGSSHTVQYGKIGTAGQSKTKDCPTEAAARAAVEKLIAEKVGKGYVEVAAGKAPALTAPKPAAAKKQAPPAEPPGPAAPLAVTREVNLKPEDWPRAFWRIGEAKPARPPRPFDLKACLGTLKKIPVHRYASTWEWQRITLPEVLSPEEAHFWFEARSRESRKRKPATVAGDLARMTFDGKLSVEALREQVRKRAKAHDDSTPLLGLARFLLGPLPTAEFVVAHDAEGNEPWGPYHDSQVAQWTVFTLLPLLSDKERAKLKGLVKAQLTPARRAQWSAARGRSPLPLHLAAALGMHEELRDEVNRLPDGLFKEFTWCSYRDGDAQRLILSLPEPEEVVRHFRRLGLKLETKHHIAGWLIRTGFTQLDPVRDAIQVQGSKADAEEMAKVFCQATAPEMAGRVMQLKLDSKASGVARGWLDDHPANAIAGLIPFAAGTGRLAEAARDFLKDCRRRGHGPFIEEQLKAHPAAERLRKEVFAPGDEDIPPLDEKTTPPWLKKAMQGVSPTPVSWLNVADLPALRCGLGRLSETQVRGVVTALQASTLDKPHPLVGEVKKHLDRRNLDAFAWKVCQRWLDDGAPTPSKWALFTVGLLGGDGCVLKLTPTLRAWPGQNQHPKAVLGLECLRAVGSDTALIQLNGIAQKLKFQGLKKKAQEFMEAIARERGMSRAELEDRIVPDLDLDERGTRVLDFGPRQFRVVLSPDLAPQVRDADGKARADLPKPGTKDDADKANAAVAEWKLLKKQLREALKIQVPRLEQAMVVGRRWAVADFEGLLVRHPLMTHLVQRLLWGGHDEKGKLLRTFRVTEEQTYADVEDNACGLEGVATVGIVHPLHLKEDVKGAWGQVFGDYDLIAPFPQLGRPTYAVEKGEAKAKVLDRLKGLKFPSLSVRGTLEKLGWTRGSADDHGIIQEFYKPFPGGEVSALVEIDPGIPMGMPEWADEQKVTRAFFLKKIYEPLSYPWHKEVNFVALGKVDAVALSEVLGDLNVLKAKAE